MTPQETEDFIALTGINPDSQDAYILRQEAANPETASHKKTPYWQEVLKAAPMIFGPGLGAAGLEALVGPATGAIAGGTAASGTAAAAHGLSTPVTEFSAAALPGATSVGAAPAAGTLAALSTPAAAVPAATVPSATTPALSTPVTKLATSSLPGKTALAAAPAAKGLSAWKQAALDVGQIAAQYGLETLANRPLADAIKEANQLNREGTAAAQKRLDAAQVTNQNVLQQQRGDYENLVSPAFNTLGGLLGLPPSHVGPVPFAPPLNANPSAPAGSTGAGPTAPSPITARTGPVGPSDRGQAQPRTLSQLTQPMTSGAGGGIQQSAARRVKAPDGQVYMIPHDQLADALQAGGSLV